MQRICRPAYNHSKKVFWLIAGFKMRKLTTTYDILHFVIFIYRAAYRH